MEGLILKLNYHSLSAQDQRSPAPTDYEHKGKMKGIAVRGNWHPKRSPLQLFEPESPPQAGGYMHALSISSRRKYSWLLFWSHRALCNNLTKTTFGGIFEDFSCMFDEHSFYWDLVSAKINISQPRRTSRNGPSVQSPSFFIIFSLLGMARQSCFQSFSRDHHSIYGWLS